MQVDEYVRVARTKWRSIAAITLVGVLAGVLWAALTPKTYTASGTFFVSASPSAANTYDANRLAQERIPSYSDLLTSHEVASRVVQQLNLSTSPDEVSSEISTSFTPTATLLNFTVTDTDSELAAKIAASAADAFTDLLSDIDGAASKTEPIVNVKLTAPPQVSEHANSASIPLYGAIGGIVGLLLGFGQGLVRYRLGSSKPAADQAPEQISH